MRHRIIARISDRPRRCRAPGALVNSRNQGLRKGHTSVWRLPPDFYNCRMPPKKSAIESCYACERPASTIEHCPPKSFFATRQRQNLITVPSCAEHNNENSKDVEYARNAITTLWGINTTGLELFERKTKKSLERSPGLLFHSFSTMEPVMQGEHVTGIYHLDIDRLELVFGACVRAIHYRDTRQKHADWGIVMPSFAFDSNVPEQLVQNWNRLRDVLNSIRFERKPTANPSVFEYGVAHLEGKHVYLHVFYGSFLVYALELSKEAAAARLRQRGGD